MALIECPECRQEVSDSAKACPNCGCKVSWETAKSDGMPQKLLAGMIFLVVAIALVLVTMSQYQKKERQEQVRQQEIRENIYDSFQGQDNLGAPYYSNQGGYITSDVVPIHRWNKRILERESELGRPLGDFEKEMIMTEINRDIEENGRVYTLEELELVTKRTREVMDERYGTDRPNR